MKWEIVGSLKKSSPYQKIANIEYFTEDGFILIKTNFINMNANIDLMKFKIKFLNDFFKINNKVTRVRIVIKNKEFIKPWAVLYFFSYKKFIIKMYYNGVKAPLCNNILLYNGSVGDISMHGKFEFYYNNKLPRFILEEKNESVKDYDINEKVYIKFKLEEKSIIFSSSLEDRLLLIETWAYYYKVYDENINNFLIINNKYIHINKFDKREIINLIKKEKKEISIKMNYSEASQYYKELSKKITIKYL